MNGTEGGDVEGEKKIGKSWKRNREERNQRKQDPNLESKEEPKELGSSGDEVKMDGSKEEMVNDNEKLAEEEAQKKQEEERIRKEEEERTKMEIETIQEYISETKRRMEWKEGLKKLNQSLENRPEESDFRKLDSSLKKNTAFVRKLKIFTEAQKSSISKEMSLLNLTKYIGEVASAIVEAKLKMSDLQPMLELCSELHQRYAEFSQHLLECWQKVLTLRRDEKVSNPSKLRVDLRFYAELISVGVFTLKGGLPLLGNVLTTLVAIDKEDHANMPIILSFCRHCGDDYAGLVPRRIRVLCDQHRYEVPVSSLLSPEKQENVRQMLKEYFSSVCKHVLNDYRELQATERTNRRILLTKGEVHADRRDRAEALQLAFSKLYSNAEQLSDALDENLPDLPKEDPKNKKDDDDAGDDLDMEDMEVSNLGPLWEDDDMKSFYENLADLQSAIPAILYKDSQQEAAAIKEDEGLDDIEEEEEDIDNLVVDDAMDEDVAPPEIEDDPEDAEQVSSSSRLVLEAFLSELPKCVNREMIDNAAGDFCLNMNTKNNRKKLVKALYTVHRNRQDLLPFYARFVATLHPCMPEVATELANLLKQEFRWQVRKKDQMKIESKLKVCRFIGELVKFKMFLRSEALFCFKQLLFDFSHHHIEMACTLVETCGRYMYRLPDSHRRTKIYLDQMMRKKAAMSMDSRYSMMIENAYYIANPPDAPLHQNRKVRPPLHQYVRKLLFTDLCKTTVEEVLKQIRKLNWEDPEESAYAVKCLGAIWNIKYFNIRYAASLLAGLVSYHEWVGPHIIDGILEDIRLQMELNEPKYNQRRTSVVKFLGELYNYRLVDSSVIFKVLYSLITFGVQMGVQPDEVTSVLDPPDHMMRIRLACTLLDTCGIYFNTGSAKKKLDYFFAYFQRYFWQKRDHSQWTEDRPFPISIINLMNETLTTLRPKLKLHGSFEEATEAVQKIEKEMLAVIREKAPELMEFSNVNNEAGDINPSDGTLNPIAEEDDMFDEEEDIDEDESYADDVGSQHSRSRSVSQMENPDNSQEDYSQRDDDEEDRDEMSHEENAMEIEEGMEDLHVPSAPKHITCEEDDDFVAMFDKMLNDNITESRLAAVPKAQQVGLTVPTHFKQAKKTYDQISQPEPEVETMQFAVLMRKGTKGTYKELSVPVEDDLARNLMKQEEADRKEKERMKQLTLEINERQEEEDLNETIAAMQRPGLVNVNRERRVRYQPPKGAPDADLIFGSKPRPPKTEDDDPVQQPPVGKPTRARMKRREVKRDLCVSRKNRKERLAERRREKQSVDFNGNDL